MERIELEWSASSDYVKPCPYRPGNGKPPPEAMIAEIVEESARPKRPTNLREYIEGSSDSELETIKYEERGKRNSRGSTS